MYGTVARFKLKPGGEAALQAASRPMIDEIEREGIGIVSEQVYRLDNEPDTYVLAVQFESREAYWRNARSATQQQRYEQVMQFVDGDITWQDGDVIFAYSA